MLSEAAEFRWKYKSNDAFQGLLKLHGTLLRPCSSRTRAWQFFCPFPRRRSLARLSSRRRREGWLRGRGPVGRVGRAPPALQAHSRIVVLCNLRVESTVAHGGEQARTDRTTRAGASGSLSCALNPRPYPNGIGPKRD